MGSDNSRANRLNKMAGQTMLPRSAFLSKISNPTAGMELTPYQENIVNELHQDAAKYGTAKTAGLVSRSPVSRMAGPLVASAFMAQDINDGYNNRDRFSKDDWRSKMSNIVANVASNFTLGLMPKEKVAQGWYGLLGGDNNDYNSPALRMVLDNQKRIK